MDADLVARLVADTDSGEALPLLAFTLAQLADGIPRGGRLSSGRYEQLRGVQGALTGQADAVAAGGRRPQEVIAGLLRLVTVDEQGRPTRWRVSRAELADPVPAEWDAFVARQLLITDTENGSVVVEIAHEAFLSAWSPLTQAITAAESALRARRVVEQAAAEWHSDARPPSQLWERGQLAAAVADTGARIHTDRRPAADDASPKRGLARWLPQRHRVLVADRVDLSPAARTFLHASIRRDRYQRRRATTVLSVLLVLALAAAGIAVFQQRSAEKGQRTTEAARQVALSRQLAVEANVVRPNDPRRAMLLALKAWQTAQNVETRSSLLSTQMESYDGDLRGYRGMVRSAAFSPDGSLVAAGGHTDGTIRLWDVASGQELANLPAGTRREGAKEPPTVTDVVFSPDGKTLVSNANTADGLRLWDVATRQQLAVFPTFGSAIALSPDGMVLAVGDLNSNLELWDVARRTQLATLTGHQGLVLSIAFSPDRRLLATAGLDKTVRLWDLHTNQEIARLLGHTDQITHISISPDGRSLASSSFDGTMRLWDVDTRQTKKIYTFENSTAPIGIAFSPDGTWLVVTGTFGAIRVIDLATGEWLGTIASPVNTDWAVAFDRTGYRLVTAGRRGTVQLWQFRLSAFTHVGTVSDVAFDPFGQTLASVSADHTVRLWDIKRSGLLHEFTGHTDAVEGVAFRPDGKSFASAGDDNTVRLWNPATGVQQAVLTTSDAVSFQEPKFSPDGTIVIATGIRVPKLDQLHLPDPEPVVWDAATGQEIGRLPADNQTVLSLAFAPDGATIAGGSSDGRIRLWNTADRTLLAELRAHPQTVRALAYSPDGRLLASGGLDRVVQLWDTSTWQLVGSVPGFSSAVRDIAFSPDGATMVTASNDTTVRLIDVASRTVSATLDRHTRIVNNVAFSPDGAIVASAGGDGRVFLWTVRESQAERRLCEVIRRGAAPDEWAEVGPDRGTPPQCP